MSGERRCNAYGCSRTAVRTIALGLVMHKAAPLATMRLCDLPACEVSARASMATRIEVRDGV